MPQLGLMERFKEFHREAILKNYPPSARVLFDTLLYEFNKAYWPEEIVFTERALMELTGLPKTSIHDAKIFLIHCGAITVSAFKNKAIYSLTDQQPTNNRPIADQSPTNHRPITDQSPTKNQNSYIRARKDVDIDIDYKEGGAGEEDLFKIWARECHRPLGETSKYELAEFEEQYGFEQCKAAIIKVSQTRAYPSFDDFKKLLTGEQSGSKYKSRARGGEKVVQFDSYPTDPRGVDTSWIYADD